MRANNDSVIFGYHARLGVMPRNRSRLSSSGSLRLRSWMCENLGRDASSVKGSVCVKFLRSSAIQVYGSLGIP